MNSKAIISATCAVLVALSGAYIFEHRPVSGEKQALCSFLKPKFGEATPWYARYNEPQFEDAATRNRAMYEQSLDKKQFAGQANYELILTVRRKVADHYKEFAGVTGITIKGNAIIRDPLEDAAELYAQNLGYAICVKE